jgi:hypothetical protein
MYYTNKDNEVINVTEQKIDIQVKEIELLALKSQLENTMPVKKEPDKETLDFWNAFAQREVKRIDALTVKIATFEADVKLLKEAPKGDITLSSVSINLK